MQLLTLILSLQVLSPTFGEGFRQEGLAELPASVSVQDLMELSQSGEVLFLPRRSSSPFNALVVTQTSRKCSEVHQTILNVEKYADLWEHIDQEVDVKYRKGNKTRYTLHLDLPLAPSLEGLLEDLGPNEVRFHDLESKGYSTFRLHSNTAGCLLNYQLYQPLGKESGFVTLLRKMEDGIGDSAELSAALATIRGYAPRRKNPKAPSTRALKTMERLAQKGIVLLVQHKRDGKVKVLGRRQVAQGVSEVLAKVAKRESYAEQADFLAKATEEGTQTHWQVAYFGGRVNFTTQRQQSGTVNSVRGLRIVEKAMAGDLQRGQWAWRVRDVSSGSDVSLEVDLDLTEGSFILRTLSRHDTTIREAARIQMVLSLLVDHVGGRGMTPSPRIARVR